MRTAVLDEPVPVQIRIPDGDTHIASWLLDGRWYERPLLDDIRAHTEPGQSAVDVGAHIGNHTVWMAAVCGLKVLALEPNPAVCAVLRENVALNHLDGVMVMAAAAGARTGRGILHLEPGANSGTTRVGEFRRGDVSIVALDDLLRPDDLAVIKIDVEGMEVDVLHGMKRLLEDHRPIVFVEVTPETKHSVHRWFMERDYERYFHLRGRRTLGYRSLV